MELSSIKKNIGDKWEEVLEKVDRAYRYRKVEFSKKINSGKKRYYYYVAGVGGGIGLILGEMLGVESSSMTIISAGGVAACISWASIELNKESKNKEAEEKVYDKFESSCWSVIDKFGEEVVLNRDKWVDLRRSYFASKEEYDELYENVSEEIRKVEVFSRIAKDKEDEFGFFSCKDLIGPKVLDRDKVNRKISDLKKAKESFLKAADVNKNFKMSMLAWEADILKEKDKAFFYFSQVRTHAHINDGACDDFEEKLASLVGIKVKYIDAMNDAMNEKGEDGVVGIDDVEWRTKDMIKSLKSIRDMAYVGFEDRSLNFQRSVRLIFSSIIFIVSFAFGYNVSWDREVHFSGSPYIENSRVVDYEGVSL